MNLHGSFYRGPFYIDLYRHFQVSLASYFSHVAHRFYGRISFTEDNRLARTPITATPSKYLLPAGNVSVEKQFKKNNSPRKQLRILPWGGHTSTPIPTHPKNIISGTDYKKIELLLPGIRDRQNTYLKKTIAHNKVFRKLYGGCFIWNGSRVIISCSKTIPRRIIFKGSMKPRCSPRPGSSLSTHTKGRLFNRRGSKTCVNAESGLMYPIEKLTRSEHLRIDPHFIDSVFPNENYESIQKKIKAHKNLGNSIESHDWDLFERVIQEFGLCFREKSLNVQNSVKRSHSDGILMSPQLVPDEVTYHFLLFGSLLDPHFRIKSNSSKDITKEISPKVLIDLEMAYGVVDDMKESGIVHPVLISACRDLVHNLYAIQEFHGIPNRKALKKLCKSFVNQAVKFKRARLRWAHEYTKDRVDMD